MSIALSEQKELLKNFFQDIWVARNTSALDKYCHPSVVYHKQSWAGRGKVGDFDDLKDLVITFKDNFDQPELQLHDIFSGEDNKIVARFSLNAQRLDEKQKESLVITALHVYRFEQGKIMEIWGINLSNFSYDF